MCPIVKRLEHTEILPDIKKHTSWLHLLGCFAMPA